jgi:hypothetical protein
MDSASTNQSTSRKVAFSVLTYRRRHSGVEVELKTLEKFVELSTAVGFASVREVAAQAELCSSFV